MKTDGIFRFDTQTEAESAFESVGPAAQTVTREVAKSMDFDRKEYDERVTSAVVETAREALFASLLAVQVGSREEFDDWRTEYDGEVHVVGHETVSRVVWHVGPTDEAVAATFENEETAAVATLRRQAFGRLYRPVLGLEADH